MSRVRIVGGTITKHTGGQHNMYAEENIVFHSEKIVSEKGGDKGVLHGKPKKNKPKTDLKILKVEGPFDKNGNIVKVIRKGIYYTYKATPSRKPNEIEVKILKWSTKNDDNKINELQNISRCNTLVKDKIIVDIAINQDCEKAKIYAYFKKASETVSVEVKIEVGEILLIAGTEQHSQTYGNKLMFPAQAVREIRENYKNNKHATIIIFNDAFTNMQISIIKRDARALNKTLYFKKINSTSELISYINNGDVTINRKNIKIETIKIFSHGLPSVLDFGLDGDNEESQKLKISDVNKMEKESFVNNPTIYSYACRTGNTDDRTVTLNPSYKYDSESIKLIKSKESLAQKLSDHLDAKVFAFLRRSNYTSSWLDGGDKNYVKNYITIEDEEVSNPINPKDWFRKKWDEALWNKDGAYLPPTSGNSPAGLLPGGIFIFEKGKEPKKQ